ncbi:MAG: DUF1080 domain-containing protein [Verrucomicrobiales bacterium]|nr:DUF1080 domain-containing protein [Verrucomicrobiales bacterium]MDP4792764.1 DUF1080 domain-containing protein [Verrucomicrobiales bacterium]MDP5005834.1 DUF1080 domain-containing protein [Verrucomicrobiales bacterium]
MKYAGGSLIFLVVFVAVGIAMHAGLYGRPGIFVWSMEENPATGKSALVRTKLEVETAVETAPASEVSLAAGAAEPAGDAAPAEETAPAEKAADVKGDAGELVLFDGKTLGNWQTTQFGGEGDVFVDEEGNLELGFGAVITGVNWKGGVPATSNYEISLEAMKLDGNDFFLALTFPVKDSHATFVVGGWGGGVVGISSVDDLNASENETMNIEGFEKDVWHKIRVRVTDNKLQAWIGEDQKVDLELEGRKISLLPGDIELSVPIGIAAYQTRARYRNIIWRNLDSAE